MKFVMFLLIFGGLIACMADAEIWSLFLISKGVGVVALLAGAALIIREEKAGRI